MLKKPLFGFVLFGAFCTLLLAQTQPKVQLSEATSGKEAKEMLQNFPKESKSTIKISKDSKYSKNARGGMYPFNGDVIPAFNEATDSVVPLKVNGNSVFLVTYTTNQPIAEIGEILNINNSRLKSPDDYAVLKWNPTTKELESEKVNAETYYNGGSNPTDKYPEWGMPYSNSFGMWLKLGGYFSQPISLFNRNEQHHLEGGGYRIDFFNFRLLESGQLSVTTKLTNYSTQSIVTSKPIPLNKWVYVQAIQEVRNYKLGWKAQDGSDEELVQKEFSADTIKLSSYDRAFDTTDMERYIKNPETRLYFNVKEVFYNPIVKMFELMDNYNAKEKLISSTGGRTTYSIDTLALESYIIFIGGTSSILTLNDIDIYYDPETLDILLVDWRVNRRGAGQ